MATGAVAEDAQPVETVVVTGKAMTKSTVSALPESLPASTTVITAEEIERQPVTRYTDLFREVPGVTISNFQPGGLAVGMAMRGYGDGNHGSEVARIVDGMPLATVGNIGAADLNWILPETLERVEVIRGPFSAEYGETALGGVVNMVTKRADHAPMVGVQAGSYETARGVTTYSRGTDTPGSGLVPYLAAEVYSTRGWQDNSEYERYNVMGKISKDLSDGVVAARLQASQGTWGAPNYFPWATYHSGLNEQSAVSEFDGGTSNIQMLVLNYNSRDPDNGWTVSGYTMHNEFTRYATAFTTQLQSSTHDKRTVAGGTVKRTWTGEIGGMEGQILAGGDLRLDDASTAGASVIRQEQGKFSYNVDYTRQLIAGFAQGQIKPLSWLKLTLGGRYDRAFYEVDNNLAPSQSGTPDIEVFSPKAGITVTPVSWMDVFANYGQGFRMPIVPNEMRTNLNMDAQKVISQEAGLQFRLPMSSSVRTAVWHTTQDSEITSIGGVYQNWGGSQRDGFDLEGRTYLVKAAGDTLSLYGAYSRTLAKLVDRFPSVYVAGVPSYVATLGVEGEHRLGNGDTVGGALNVQFNGRKHADDSGTLMTHTYQVAQGKLTYGFGETLSLFGQGAWYLGDRFSEIGSSSSTTVQPELNGLIGITYRFQ